MKSNARIIGISFIVSVIVSVIISALFCHFCFGVNANQIGAAQEKQVKNNENGDGEIIAFLIAVDEHEINAAKKVENKVKNTEVKSFAQRMIKDHTANLSKTREISTNIGIAAEETNNITNFKMQGSKEIAELIPLTGLALEETYINDMVKDHEGGLKQIDEYLKTVKNSAVKSLLESTKPVVALHLELAKKAQENLAATKKE